MKPTTIKNRKGRKLDRVNRVLEAQSELTDFQVRSLLILIYENLSSNDWPYDKIQNYLDKVTSLLCRLNEEQVKHLQERLPKR